ncbi:MAG: helix-turn-helix domain-containing protein, partial [Myxococcota bacterium]
RGVTDLSTREVATRLNRSIESVRRWIDLDYFPGAWRTPGGHWNIPETDVDAFRQRQKRHRPKTRQESVG